jgi:GAF domain-containing protein
MSTHWLKQGMNSVVFLPLFYQSEVFATLILASRRANAYKERELKLLRYAAGQLATQLKNFQLLAWNQRRERWMTTLDTLMVTITSGEELSEVFPQLAHGLKKVVPFDRIALTSVEGETLRIVDAFPQEEYRPWLGEIYPIEDSAIPWMIEHRRINIEEDFAQEQQFSIDEIHLKEGLRAEVRVPFFSQGKLFASLHMLNSKPYHPEQEELALLGKLSYYLTGPMESLIYHSPVKKVAELV